MMLMPFRASPSLLSGTGGMRTMDLALERKPDGFPEFVRDNEVYAAVSGGEPFGFYALTGTDRERELEHLWVSPAWIGSGAGRLLFERAMDRAASQGAKLVKIEADPNAEGFYLRMGARRVGETSTRSKATDACCRECWWSCRSPLKSRNPGGS